MIDFRNLVPAEIGARLIVHTNDQGDYRRHPAVPWSGRSAAVS
jgi:hypothetical protein